MIRRWLLNPPVQRWWGNAASAEAEIRMALDSPMSLCRIIEVAGQSIGYAQSLDAGAGGSDPVPGVALGAWSCNLFIGSEPHRGQGFGQQALDQLAAEVFASTLAVACTILVSIRNERAARAYEKVGFRWATVVHDALMGPSWAMIRERPGR